MLVPKPIRGTVVEKEGKDGARMRLRLAEGGVIAILVGRDPGRSTPPWNVFQPFLKRKNGC